jgi:hypothetical protein
MENQLEEGVLFFNYRGYLGMSGFSNGNVDNANNGYKLPFATVLTCGTGSFAEDQTTMSEKFFRAGSASNPKGAVAAIGTATWNTHTLFKNIMDMGIYDGLFVDDVETAGAALASGKLALYSTYPTNPDYWVSAFTQWNNLIGDPATHLWTDTPTILSISHTSEIYDGTNFIDIVVQDENGNNIDPIPLWPNKPIDFKSLWTNYYRKCEILSKEILSLMALALNLESNYFNNFLTSHSSVLRGAFYPQIVNMSEVSFSFYFN